jgi:ferritin
MGPVSDDFGIGSLHRAIENTCECDLQKLEVIRKLLEERKEAECGVKIVQLLWWRRYTMEEIKEIEKMRDSVDVVDAAGVDNPET